MDYLCCPPNSLERVCDDSSDDGITVQRLKTKHTQKICPMSQSYMFEPELVTSVARLIASTLSTLPLHLSTETVLSLSQGSDHHVRCCSRKLFGSAKKSCLIIFMITLAFLPDKKFLSKMRIFSLIQWWNCFCYYLWKQHVNF